MQAVLLNNENEYINWVADLIEYGAHVPNLYAEPNQNGTNVCDRFIRYNPEDCYKYFGIYAGIKSPYDLEDEYHPPFPPGWTRQDLKVDHAYADELDYAWIPTPSDYPILYHSWWEDDFDRVGKVKVRQNVWFSLAGPHLKADCVRTKYAQWHLDHHEEHKKWIRLSNER